MRTRTQRANVGFAVAAASLLVTSVSLAQEPVGRARLTSGERLERIVISSIDGYRQSSYPSIERLADGRLLCVFSAIDKRTGGKMIVAGRFSSDHGRTWSEPQVLIDTKGLHDYDPNIVVIGRRVIVSSTTTPAGEAITVSRTIAVRSEDNGRTWGKPYDIPMGHRYTSGKINNGIVLRDGSVLFGYTWEPQLEKIEKLPSEGDMIQRSAVMISRDGGDTWTSSEGVADDALKIRDRKGAISGICEPAIVELSDGTIYMLARTGVERLYESRSKDGGQTWSRPVASPLTGHNAPAAVCRFTGKRPGILVVWNNSPVDRWPLCVAASFDDARTWTPPVEIANTPGFQCSYPGCTQAADGKLVVTWQQAGKNGTCEVLAVRFPPEWLVETAASRPSAESRPGGRPNVAAMPMPREEPVWVERHRAINARARRGGVDIVFLGDSITQRWESAGRAEWALFGDRALNAGIDGNGTQTVLWRIRNGNIDGIRPRAAVLMIGTNNSTDPNQSSADIAEGISAIVQELRDRLPATKILLLAIFPRGKTVTPERVRGSEASRLASRLADGKWVHYLDIGSSFLEPDGSISAEVMPDFVHLSAKGYVIWAKAMKPKLDELLADD